jgi:hypothetical protein
MDASISFKGRRVTTLIIALLGVLLTITAHLSLPVTQRRARDRYHALMGEHQDNLQDPDIWADLRPYAGGWGCLVIVLRFLRGLGLLVACSMIVYRLSEI